MVKRVSKRRAGRDSKDDKDVYHAQHYTVPRAGSYSGENVRSTGRRYGIFGR